MVTTVFKVKKNKKIIMLIINHDGLSTKIIVWEIKLIKEICFFILYY